MEQSSTKHGKTLLYKFRKFIKLLLDINTNETSASSYEDIIKSETLNHINNITRVLEIADVDCNILAYFSWKQ